MDENPPIPKLLSLLGTILVNNTMVSTIWVMALFLICIVLLAWIKADTIIIFILLIFLLFMILFYFYTYIYFMKNDPNKLLSEKSFLTILRMQRGGSKGNEKFFNEIEGEKLLQKSINKTTQKLAERIK